MAIAGFWINNASSPDFIQEPSPSSAAASCSSETAISEKAKPAEVPPVSTQQSSPSSSATSPSPKTPISKEEAPAEVGSASNPTFLIFPSSPLPTMEILPSQTLPEITNDIESRLNALGKQLRFMYRNLKQILTKKGNELFDNINQFEQDFGRYRGQVGGTLFPTFDLIKAQANFLKTFMDTQIIETEYQQALGADARGVKRQPKDGNCWLHASLDRLQDLNPQKAVGETPVTLRLRVVDWMVEHYNEEQQLQDYLDGNKKCEVLCASSI